MAPFKRIGKEALITPIVAAICLAADILTKNWARENLVEGVTNKVLPGIIHLTLTANTGAAFSLGRDNAAVMSSVAGIMTIVLIAWTVRRELKERFIPRLDRIGMGCLLGGALGNLLDRFIRGRVTDFLDLGFMNFPVFNVADALIDVGIGLLILGTLNKKDKESTSAKQSPTEMEARKPTS